MTAQARRTINVDPLDKSTTTDEAIAALADGGDRVYVRGRGLVEIVTSSMQLPGQRNAHDVITVRGVPRTVLCERLETCARFVRTSETNDGPVQQVVGVPGWVISHVGGRGAWPELRVLNGVTESPVLRPDGTVLTTPGYDATTGLVYRPSADFPPVPERPSLADVARAVAELWDVVREFPFERPEHGSAWFAALLTTFARPAFAGPAPLFLIDAATRGTGKTLLARATSMITTGRDASLWGFIADEAEMDKRITAIAMAAVPLVVFDNVATVLGGENLCRAITSTIWAGRKLGGNDVVDLPLAAVWICTGNNVQIGRDMDRRILHVRLVALQERPEERAIERTDLLGYIRANRGRLVVAALTILRAHAVADRPRVAREPFGAFEDWDAVVRQACVWAGVGDPLATRAGLRAVADGETELVGALFAALERFAGSKGSLVRGLAAKGVTSKAICEEFARDGASDLRDAIEGLRGATKPGLPDTRAIGRVLGRYRQRIVRGLRLDSRDTGHGSMAWVVLPAGASGSPGEIRVENDTPNDASVSAE